MKKNNRGISLIELITVIGILAICVGIAGLSVVAAFNTRATKSVRLIEAYLSQCRVTTLAKGDSYYVKIYSENGNVYGTLYNAGAEVSSEQLGKKVALTISVDDAPVEADCIYLSYSHATGAFKKLSEVPCNGGNSEFEGVYCTSIAVASGSKNVAVMLTPLTGRSIIGGVTG